MRTDPGQYAVILDLGSAYYKTGLGGELFPRTHHHSVVGKAKQSRVMAGSEYIRVLSGTEAYVKRDFMDLVDVVGEDMEYCHKDLLHPFLSDASIKDLKIEATGRGLLVTEK